MPLHLSRIRALCFDIDGTLSNSDDQMVAQLGQVLHPVRFLLPGKNARRAARRLVMAAEAPANFFIGLSDLVGADGSIFALVD